jgi:hypothetical protein
VVLATAVRLCEELAVFDPALLTGDDCARVVEVLSRTEKVVAAARARAAFRAAECGSHGGRGLSDAAEWLARQSGSSNSKAREDLAAALAAEECSVAREGLLDGSFSLAQAGEIAETERVVPGSAAELADVARRESLGVLREKAREIRVRAVDPDDLHHQQKAAQSHRHWRDKLGMVRYSGAMLPEHGVPAMNRLDAETDRIFRKANQEGRCEPREVYAAEAFAAMVKGAPGKPAAKSADIVFVVNLNAYRRGRVEPGETCHIVGGGPVPVDIVKEIERDAFLKVALHDGVNIHTVKHFGRYIKAELRTALNLGPAPDFTGLVCKECGKRYRIQDDHHNPVANGGETSYINLNGLCPACHLEKTQRDRAAGLLNGKRTPTGPDVTAPDPKSGKDPP